MAQPRAEAAGRSLARHLLWAVPVVVVLLLLPQVIDVYQTQLLTYALVFAIAALGFNLLLGYTGLLSFGHSAYFGVGAYSAALMVKYLGISSMELYILGGVLVTGVVAAAFGYICVRYTRIFFAILTLALSQVLWTLAYKFFWVTGGTDGIRVPFSGLTLLGGLIDFTERGAYLAFVHTYYYYVLFLFVCCVVLMWLIVHSPFGKALQAIRDNETRAQFLGVRIIPYRWSAFLLSGCFTGLAGILWVPMNDLVTPDVLYWPFSGEIVFMTLLGGFRNFAGPIVGAVVYTYLETYAVATTQYWQFLLGIVLLVLVMALPIGLVGAAARLVAYGRERWAGAESRVATDDRERRGGAAT
jgi:branched-chain amino acid transport system permease protein